MANSKKTGLLIFMCWLIYVTAYLGRYSFNSNITLIEEHFQVKHAQTGLVSTLFFFAYGAGQVVNGLFCSRYDKRIVLPAVMFLSAGINLAVALGVPFAWYKYLWLINGAVQSVLWSSLVSVLSQSCGKKALGRAIVVMSTTTPCGMVITYGVSALFSFSGSFVWSFLFGGVVMFLSGLIWLCAYSKEKYDHEEVAEEKPLEKGTEKRQRGLSVYLQVFIVVIAFFAVVNNFVKDGLNTWVPSILKEGFSLTDGLSILLTIVLSVMGIFGAILSNFLFKKIGDCVLLTGILFLGSAVCTLGVVLLFDTPYFIAILLFFGVTVMLLHGVNNVVTGIIPMYMRDKFNSGKMAGILNGFCYLGSTLSTYVLGLIADGLGWYNACVILLVICALPILFAAAWLLIKRRLPTK